VIIILLKDKLEIIKVNLLNSLIKSKEVYNGLMGMLSTAQNRVALPLPLTPE